MKAGLNLGRMSPIADWPAFFGQSLGTAYKSENPDRSMSA